MSQPVESYPKIMLEAQSTRDRIALILSKYFSPLFAVLASNLIADYDVHPNHPGGDFV